MMNYKITMWIQYYLFNIILIINSIMPNIIIYSYLNFKQVPIILTVTFKG